MVSLNDEHSYSARSIRNGLVSGYIAGITGIVVGHPLDSIKVLLQTNGGGTASSSSVVQRTTATTTIAASAGQIRAYSSSNIVSLQSSAAKAISQTAILPSHSQGSIIGKRSLRALYSGVTGPILTTGLFQSLNFAIYDSVRRVLYQQQIQSQDDITISRRPDDYLHYDNLFNTFIASFLAGASTSVLTSPMIIVKTKQQIKVWGFRRSIKETYLCGLTKQSNILNGIRNFYTGFGFHFFCDSIGRGVYMYSYELLKRQLAHAKLYNKSATNEQLQQSKNRISTANLSIPERMICAASSGMICWAFIFPADVIRSKLYAKSLNTQVQPTTIDGIHLARQMVKEQGIKSLYRGMGVTVLRAGPVAAAVLPVYDSVLEWLSS